MKQTASTQHGFSLIETLTAFIITSIIIIKSMQLNSITWLQNQQHQQQQELQTTLIKAINFIKTEFNNIAKFGLMHSNQIFLEQITNLNKFITMDQISISGALAHIKPNINNGKEEAIINYIHPTLPPLVNRATYICFAEKNIFAYLVQSQHKCKNDFYKWKFAAKKIYIKTKGKITELTSKKMVSHSKSIGKVTGVEYLFFLYGVDTDLDGFVDIYQTSSTLQQEAMVGSSLIKTIIVQIIARSHNQQRTARSNTISLINGQQIHFNDGYHRATTFTTIKI